ncbi:MAG TPA: methyltransferase domain-containing protein [Bryobacteraceae bacterium]|nr:methyltransferase domain-containing protein [Bryobacteraceae bacterium]
MAVWNPAQYLRYSDLRTRPSYDLAQRIRLVNPRRIVDLGCGPGNSTDVCAERWPEASILGIDNSPAMIEKARAAWPDREWEIADIAQWVYGGTRETFDVIFSSAALQWVPDHATLFPRLLGHLRPGGVLAIQMPAYDATPNAVMREQAADPAWRRWFPEGRAEEWLSHPLERYHEILAPHASSLDLWATDYLQIMPNFEAIVEWYKGTGLRPYLGAIRDEAEQKRFLAEYAERLRPHYPASSSGDVLFSFRRLFIVAS